MKRQQAVVRKTQEHKCQQCYSSSARCSFRKIYSLKYQPPFFFSPSSCTILSCWNTATTFATSWWPAAHNTMPLHPSRAAVSALNRRGKSRKPPANTTLSVWFPDKRQQTSKQPAPTRPDLEHTNWSLCEDLLQSTERSWVGYWFKNKLNKNKDISRQSTGTTNRKQKGIRNRFSSAWGAQEGNRSLKSRAAYIHQLQLHLDLKQQRGLHTAPSPSNT